MQNFTLFIVFLIIILFTGCTENQRARNFGGTSTVNLPKSTKLINATWKADALWYLYRPMQLNESPETITFKEDSSFGVFQGEVIFIESN